MHLFPLSVFAWSTFALWCILALYITFTARIANAEIAERDHSSWPKRIFKVAGMGYLLAVIYFPNFAGMHALNEHAGQVQGCAGLLVCTAGVVLVIMSLRTLGRNWSDLVVLKHDHQLVQAGPYRWVRHPLYDGMLLAVAGSAMTVGTVVAYACVPVLFLGFLLKAGQEETLLQSRFQEYGAYRRRVKGFIPFVL